MDFNPWGEKTDGLLFEWSELEEISAETDLVYRVIDKANSTQRSGLDQYKVPIV